MLIPNESILDQITDKALSKDDLGSIMKEMNYRARGQMFGLCVFASSLVFFILGILVIILGYSKIGLFTMIFGVALHMMCLFTHLTACHKKRETHVSIIAPRRPPRF